MWSRELYIYNFTSHGLLKYTTYEKSCQLLIIMRFAALTHKGAFYGGRSLCCTSVRQDCKVEIHAGCCSRCLWGRMTETQLVVGPQNMADLAELIVLSPQITLRVTQHCIQSSETQVYAECDVAFLFTMKRNPKQW